MTTDAEFEARIGAYRSELHAYCYRMLGSLQDADDALQETLLGAWRGMHGFEGRSSLRSWLYRIATNACLRLIAERPKRILSPDYGPPTTSTERRPFVDEPIWLEPYPEPAQGGYELLESLELAFVAALQHLPATQRAVLILREVLEFSAAEVADLLGTSVASVNSALQRAREAVQSRVPARSQQATLRELGDAAQRELVGALITAWERSDVDGIVALLCRDAKFTMPPLPSWYEGREAIAHFLRECVFATEWRVVPSRASGQLALACYQSPDFRLSAFNVLSLRGREIEQLTAFLDPALHARLRVPDR